MKVYLTDQINNFKKHLHFLKTSEIMPYDKKSLKEKITTVELQTNRKLDQLNLDFLFDY
jgi:hypothetical protein